jgi:predicted metal-dependent hydrolase
MTIFEEIIPTFPFNYSITRSKRKTLAIYIKSGKIDIRAPLNSPDKWINEFIETKTPWIQKQLSDQQQKLAQKLVIADNCTVSFFGHPRTIQVIISTQQKIEMNWDHLFIYTRKNTPEQLEKLFNRWLMDQAKEYMATQTIKTARILGVESKLKEVVFRKTKTKWGHCCHDGTIQYNWLTMMAPKPVVDYLIAHETSHLLHMNHSKRFWATVEKLCPDYLNLTDWLKHNGHRLWTVV